VESFPPYISAAELWSNKGAKKKERRILLHSEKEVGREGRCPQVIWLIPKGKEAIVPIN